MIPAYVFPLLLAGLAWQPAYGASLYKWVDSAGRVTYSSLPPPAGAKGESVATPPQPSAEDIRQAQEQVKRAKEQASGMEEQRRSQEAREAEEARLREMQPRPVPAVVEVPVYLPQPIYYPPVMAPPPKHHHDKPPQHRRR